MKKEKEEDEGNSLGLLSRFNVDIVYQFLTITIFNGLFCKIMLLISFGYRPWFFLSPLFIFAVIKESICLILKTSIQD